MIGMPGNTLGKNLTPSEKEKRSTCRVMSSQMFFTHVILLLHSCLFFIIITFVNYSFCRFQAHFIFTANCFNLTQLDMLFSLTAFFIPCVYYSVLHCSFALIFNITQDAIFISTLFNSFYRLLRTEASLDLAAFQLLHNLLLKI